MKDTITEEDMLMDLTKTEIEKRLMKTEQENGILKDKLDSVNGDIRRRKNLMQVYVSQLKQAGELALVHN